MIAGRSYHVHKKAIRALGISESFTKGLSEKSVLAGVVMRSDMVIDGFVFSTATVGGMDATQKIIEMYESLGRADLNVVLLNGCVISWYNVVDLHEVAEKTQLPLICVTYEESEGLEKYFMKFFPEDWRIRVETYRKNRARTPLELRTGHTVFVRFINIDEQEARVTLDKFTVHGSIPEPLRVARLAARSVSRVFDRELH
ncbi:MAG: DUF99 family protein [Nitrososphaerota archaeon]|nr:DUF99 family protein [Candidatus Bathyarchaeota archaeon]MDW8048737.1 DUF99 family protein [Nitrososphaerota archaeon]